MLTSPLRYPGGKGRMFKSVENLIKENGLTGCTYVEPFSGGFGIGIKLLTSGCVDNVIINDVDKHIYAFWYSVFNNTQKLVDLIKETPVDLEHWRQQKDIYNNYSGSSLLKKGFAAFYLNRTNYSGVLKGGPIGGYAQDGNYTIGCRFNKEKLIRQIKALSEYREHVQIYNYDAIKFIQDVIIPIKNEVFVNFDPPYVEKGSELYRNFYTEKDHIELADYIKANLKEVYWIITYDNCPLIEELYNEYSPKEYLLTHMAGIPKKGKELLIENFNLQSLKVND